MLFNKISKEENESKKEILNIFNKFKDDKIPMTILLQNLADKSKDVFNELKSIKIKEISDKKLELYVQKKDYQNAHKTQIDIAELTKNEKEKFEQEKFKTIQKEIENLQKKQQNETKGLEQKIQSSYNSFKKNRALKVLELLLKYKNQFRDLKSKQQNKINDLQRVVQGGILKQGKKINYSNEVRKKNIQSNK